MGRQYSKDREDEQCLTGETVSVLPDKTDEKVRVLPDDEWDFFCKGFFLTIIVTDICSTIIKNIYQ